MSVDRDSAAESNHLPRVLSALDLLTEAELCQLNQVVVQRLRLMQQIRAHGQMAKFHVGQPVAFTDQTGRPLRGVVARHNRTSVTVVTSDGAQWRVSPQFLRKE